MCNTRLVMLPIASSAYKASCIGLLALVWGTVPDKDVTAFVKHLLALLPAVYCQLILHPPREREHRYVG